MRYVIVDLEATCWEKGSSPARMEIIEIGAVIMEDNDAVPTKEFSSFVKPVVEPVLSAFCTQLTSIRQQDVDDAEDFTVVFPKFVEWIGSEPFMLCSWGAYDLNQFRTDCQRHHIPLPSTFERHINLKKAFAEWKKVKPCGMKAALYILKIPLEGTHHRAIDDVRNIAKIVREFLPYISSWVDLPMTIDYLNTDLTILTNDLQVLAKAFEDRGLTSLGAIPPECGLCYMSFETEHQHDAPEPNIESFLKVIENLDGVALKAWNACELREFDIGYQCGTEPWKFKHTLSASLLKRIAAANMSLRISLYPTEYSRRR